MPRKGESIYKRKDGRWEARYIKGYSMGKAIYGYVYASSYLEVKKKRNEILKTVVSKKQDISLSSMCTVKDISMLWLRKKKNEIKTSTYMHYKMIVYNHIIPKIGCKTLNSLTTVYIDSYIENLLDCGRLDHKKGLSTKSVSDILMIVKSIMRYAQNCGYNINCQLENIKIRQSKKIIRILSIDEQKCLYEYLIDHMGQTELSILLSLCTGIRLGELCALRWEDIDIPNKTLKVRSTMQRVTSDDKTSSKKTIVTLTKPKSDCSIRDIPILDILIPFLVKYQKENHVYITSGTPIYIEPRTFHNRFKAITKKLNMQDISFHSLRHTFATRCVEMDFEIKSLSEVLGHSSVQITLDRYVHSSFTLKQENMHKMNEMIAHQL